jgi:NADH-quinone oxidoreductase subunit J
VFLLADFIAITQLLIYVGGILVLILFGVMLTSHQIHVDAKTGIIQTLPTFIIMVLFTTGLIYVFWTTNWQLNPQLQIMDKTAPQIGELLLTKYLLPFEIASVILLVALIGAAMIARREKKPKD